MVSYEGVRLELGVDCGPRIYVPEIGLVIACSVSTPVCTKIDSLLRVRRLEADLLGLPTQESLASIYIEDSFDECH